MKRPMLACSAFLGDASVCPDSGSAEWRMRRSDLLRIAWRLAAVGIAVELRIAPAPAPYYVICAGPRS